MENNEKTFYIKLFLLISIVSSCTKTLYTHNDVMNRYKTKTDIITKFGMPTEKRSESGLEEWYYNFGTKTTYTYSNTQSSLLTGNANTSNKFVKFIIKNDSVVNWKTQGVDLKLTEINKKQPTLAIILGTLGSIGFLAFCAWLGSLG